MEQNEKWKEIATKEIEDCFLKSNNFLSFLRNKKLLAQQDTWNNTEICINLKFDLQTIDRWRPKMNSVPFYKIFDYSPTVWSFVDYIEEFLLKGKYAMKPDHIRLKHDTKSDCLIWNCESIESIFGQNRNEFYEKLLSLKNEFVERDNLVLICNPSIFRKESQEHIKSQLGFKELIPIKDKALLCFLNLGNFIPKYERSYLPFRFFEEPPKIYMDYDGGTSNNFYRFWVSWSGVLKIKDKDAIKCIKIIY